MQTPYKKTKTSPRPTSGGKKFVPSPGKRSFAPQGKTIYIGNLNYKVREKELYELFGKFGKVRHVNLILKPGTELSKGIAFVQMLKSAHADKAIKLLDGRVIGGRTIKVSEAEDNMQPNKVKPKKLTKAAKEKKASEDKIVELISKKKPKRSRGLEELFENTRK